MKPVTINLVNRKNILEKVFLGFVTLFVIATLGISLSNAVEYYGNKKVVKTYESRLKDIKKRIRQQRIEVHKKDTNNKQSSKTKQDLNDLNQLIEKNLFSLPQVLSRIETLKPDRVNINALVFSKDLKSVTIKGESNHVDSISRFIVEMEKSPFFNVELSKEEIKENRNISFELTARWVAMNNG